jgi:Fic family protein
MVSMLFKTPPATKTLTRQLAELDGLRKQLGAQTGVAAPWLGSLRRQWRAASAEGSIEIEGFHVPADETIGVASGDEPPDPRDDDRMALSCYARAMDHVGVMSGDPVFRWVDRVILDLHFDACYFQKDREPGQYRRRGIEVTSPRGGPPAYVGPPHGELPGLMGEVVEWLDHGDLDAHVAVRAAMAHLHVVSVHPFRDGNGRISRIVQSLVLAREGLLTPELVSIEEYLSQNTDAYYAALQKVQGGSYQPERDAAPWVRFCVQAHVHQARQRLVQLAEAAECWSFLEALVDRRGWPDRLVIALEQSLFQGVDRALYTAEADVSPPTASNDFRRLLDAGLVAQRGRGRTTRYVASESLRRELRRHLNEVSPSSVRTD